MIEYCENSIYSGLIQVSCPSYHPQLKHLSFCGTGQRVPLVLTFQRRPEAAKPSIIWVPEFLPGIKWPGNEDDHSPLPGAKVKNKWSYNSTPPYAFMVRTRTTLFSIAH